MNIELRNISKHYGSEDSKIKREVLDDINLTIKPGDSIAITGPSGSGKSTLLNIIGTLDKPTGGSVLIDNKDVNVFSADQLAEIRNTSIGFIFQLHHLLPQLNLMENVLIPLIPSTAKADRKKKIERAKELIEFMDLADKTTRRPGQLSVGECQRTAVVRALINNPDLILADEPTGSLDQKNADQMGDLLVRINKDFNITMIVVTHAQDLANKLETSFVLEKGKLTNNS